MTASTEDLIARLTECGNGMRSFKTSLGDYGICTEAAQALRALQQEVERKDAALHEIADHPTGGEGCNPVSFVRIARSALTGSAQG